MPKWLVFFIGAAAGAVVTFGILFIMGLNFQNNGGLIGATFFEQPGKVVNEKSFKVMQALNEHAALAHGKSRTGSYLGTLYLLYSNADRYFYDDEIITVPSGCEAVQIGVYKYTSNGGLDKTVPIVGIRDKQ